MDNSTQAVRSEASRASRWPGSAACTIRATADRCCSPRPSRRRAFRSGASRMSTLFRPPSRQAVCCPTNRTAPSGARQTARRTHSRADVPAGKCAARCAGESGPAGAAALSRRRSVSRRRKAEFDAGSQYMEAAMRLTPESLYLEGRERFLPWPRIAVRQAISARRRICWSNPSASIRARPTATTRSVSPISSRPISPKPFRLSATRRSARQLVVSAAQSRARVCRSGRLSRRHPQLSAGDADHAAVQLSAL